MTRLSKRKLASMIEEATVDAYNELEQAAGWHAMIEDHLALPFETKVLGVEVKVIELDLRSDNSIVAVCQRDGERQAIPILDLPLPKPKPEGAEWIEAYRHWLRG